MSIENVRVNDVISFVYNGGSYPGAVRRVCVTDNLGHAIKGYDIDKQGFRNYTGRLMHSIIVMDNKPLSFFTKRKDAIKVQQQLKDRYGYMACDVKLIEDILTILEKGI